MWHLKKTQCLIHTFTSAELLFSYSVVLDSLRPPRTAAPQASLFFTIFWSLLKLTSIESVSHPMIHSLSPLLFLPSVFPSIRVISNELVLGSRWPKYWSFSLSISLSNEYSGLISFRKGTGEPGGLLSMGSHRVGHDWSDLAAAGNLDPPMLCKWHYFILSLRLSSIPLYTYITSISIHLSGTFRLFTYPDFCK